MKKLFENWYRYIAEDKVQKDQDRSEQMDAAPNAGATQGRKDAQAEGGEKKTEAPDSWSEFPAVAELWLDNYNDAYDKEKSP